MYILRSMTRRKIRRAKHLGLEVVTSFQRAGYGCSLWMATSQVTVNKNLAGEIECIHGECEWARPARNVPVLATATCYMWDGDVFGNVRAWYDELDAISGDLEVVASGLRHLIRKEMFCAVVPERLIVLDSVWVHDMHRGRGLGRLAAGSCLYASGLWSSTSIVAAVAGARVPPEDAPPIKLRAEKLLAELGLLSYRTPSGVLFYSLPGMGKAYECVTEIVDYR